jgi:hypothetical protein
MCGSHHRWRRGDRPRCGTCRSSSARARTCRSASSSCPYRTACYSWDTFLQPPHSPAASWWPLDLQHKPQCDITATSATSGEQQLSNVFLWCLMERQLIWEGTQHCQLNCFRHNSLVWRCWTFDLIKGPIFLAWIYTGLVTEGIIYLQQVDSMLHHLTTSIQSIVYTDVNWGGGGCFSCWIGKGVARSCCNFACIFVKGVPRVEQS